MEQKEVSGEQQESQKRDALKASQIIKPETHKCEAEAENDGKGQGNQRKSLRRSWRSSSPTTKLTVVFTGIIAAATILYSAFAGWQLWEIRSSSQDTHALALAATKQADKAEGISKSAERLAKAMEDTVAQSMTALDHSINAARLDQRAWVGLKYMRLHSRESGKPISAKVGIVNTGKTIAHDGHTVLYIAVTQTKNEWRATHNPVESLSTVTYFPNFDLEHNVATIKTYSTQQLEALKTGKLYVFVWGDIEYRDVFGRSHKTEFCGYNNTWDTDTMSACETHNHAN